MAAKVEVTLAVKDQISADYKRISEALGGDNKRIREAVKQVGKDGKEGFDKAKAAAKRARDEFGKFVGGAKKAEEATKKLGTSFKTARTSILNFKTILAGAITGLFARAVLKAGTEVENLTIQFKTLLGSTEAARDRMAELSKFAQTTPFELAEVATASRQLQVLTGGALATGDSLRMVGDAAAASGAEFTELAMWVGRAYGGLQAGRPIGEAMMRLSELGVITGNTRSEIEKLQAAGKSKEAWDVLKASLERNKGAMSDLAGSVSGLWSTIKDSLSDGIRRIMASGLWDKFRGMLAGVVGMFNSAIENGTFDRIGTVIFNIGRFAIQTAKDFAPLLAIFSGSGDAIKVLSGAFQGLLGFIALTQTGFLQFIEWFLKGMRKFYEAFDRVEKFFGGKGLQKSLDPLNKSIAEFGAAAERSAARAVQAFDGKMFEGAKKGAEDLKKTVATLGPIGGDWEDMGDPKGQAAAEKAQKEREQALEAAKKLDNEMRLMKGTGLEKDIEAINQKEAEALEIKRAAGQATKEVEDAFYNERIATIEKYADAEAKIHVEMVNRKIKAEETFQDVKMNLAKQAVGLTSEIFGAGKAVFLFEKSLAAGEVIINTMRGIAAAMAEPFGFGIPRIPWIKATGAVALATIAAQTIKGFAKGGFITSGATTGDSTMARVNRGEAVLNTAQQRNFMAMANGRPGPANQTITMGDIVINAAGGSASDVARAVSQTMQERIRDLSDMLRRKNALLVS